MKKPLVTVYITTKNYGRFLGSAIESVLRQSMRDWELIVIDDNSTDNTKEVLNCYRGHPGISIYHTDGLGFPMVCNFAISKAQGEYIIRLDGDDFFDDNILLVLSNYLNQHDEVAMVFPDYYLMDEFGEIFAHEWRKRVYSDNHMLDVPPNGAATMFRMTVIKELDGYREDLGAQDGFDIWSRIIKDHKYANINLPLFYYRRHGTNLTENTQRILYARRAIKKDFTSNKLNVLRPIIAVIPIREKYDFIPNLWKEMINGKTLLQREIDVCLNSRLFDFVVVACDSREAEKVVKQNHDPRLKFFLRDEKSTIRTARITPTLEKIAQLYDPLFQGITLLQYIQAPFISSATLEEAINTLAFSNASSACGVEIINSQVFKRRHHGLEPINRLSDFTSDFDTIYRDTMSCLATKNSNLRSGSLTGASIACFEVSTVECFFVACMEHLKIARFMENSFNEEAVDA